MKKIISMLMIITTLISCLFAIGIPSSATDILVRSDEGRLPFDDIKAGRGMRQA